VCILRAVVVAVGIRVLLEVLAAAGQVAQVQIPVLLELLIPEAVEAVVKVITEAMEVLELLLFGIQIAITQPQTQPEVQLYMYQVGLEHIFGNLETDQLLGKELQWHTLLN
jgi:hypothetical protein